MPTLPWCVGPMGVGVGVGTLLSSQIPQAPSNANPNEIKIQDSSAASSGLVLFAGSLLILLHQSARLGVLAIL